MVGITRVVVTALLAAATAAALPGRPGFKLRARSVDTGSDGSSNETAQVDLGYAVHEAVLQTSNYTYYNFSNIRYAEPPVGDLRFKAPIKPQTVNRTINRGENAKVCIQASPGWTQQRTLFESNLTIEDLGEPRPSESEDCLFLDVFVPVKVWEKAAKRKTRAKAAGAPVLVWIYGGGYTAGSKNVQPETLISHAEDNGGEGVVFVAMNYRVGMFGFMAGPTFQQNGTANAGFYDQRLALEWIQENIHLFGGDPDRVTVFGESAGGGSIMYQITAFGGLKGPVPFARAIAQSPGVQPIVSNFQKEGIFERTLYAATKLTSTNITTLQQLRELDTATIRNINSWVVALSIQGTWTYGPMVDGLFAPDTAQALLAYGYFDQGVEIMAGHNTDEGRLLANPNVKTQEQFVDLLQQLAPGGDQGALEYISETLYPEDYSGAYGYTSPLTRVALIISETGFTCYTRYMMKAKKGEGYSYLFSVPPGLHGQDVAFTFYNPREPNQAFFGIEIPINATVATTLQRYITNFALSGSPNEGSDVPWFPAYGTNETVTNLGVGGIPLLQLDTVSNQPNGTNNAGDRCDWFQKGTWT